MPYTVKRKQKSDSILIHSLYTIKSTNSNCKNAENRVATLNDARLLVKKKNTTLKIQVNIQTALSRINTNKSSSKWHRIKVPKGWVIAVATATESPLVAKWLKTVEGDAAQCCLSSFSTPDTFSSQYPSFKIKTVYLILQNKSRETNFFDWIWHLDKRNRRKHNLKVWNRLRWNSQTCCSFFGVPVNVWKLKTENWNVLTDLLSLICDLKLSTCKTRWRENTCSYGFGEKEEYD